jgi:HEAT repeat protein
VEEAVAKLVKLWFGRLHDSNEGQRRQARRVLAGLTPADKNAVVDLLAFLKTDDPAYRYWAARGLSGIGPDAKEAVPALIQSLDDKDDDCRFWAVTALSSIGPAATDAIPRLIEHLQDSAFGIRQAVADALSRIAPTAPKVVPALVTTLASDDNHYVREEIVRALGHIGTPAAVAALIGTLSDKSTDLRRYAAIGLKMLGAKAKEAKKALQTLMATETDEDIRNQAEVALRRMKNA